MTNLQKNRIDFYKKHLGYTFENGFTLIDLYFQDRTLWAEMADMRDMKDVTFKTIKACTELKKMINAEIYA